MKTIHPNTYGKPRTRPDMLEIRWQLYINAKQWGYALALAEGLIESAPGDVRGWIYLCQTLRLTNRIQQAYDIASTRLPSFPDNWEFHYHTARYASLLGKREQAEDFLTSAIELSGIDHVKLLALGDPDLKPLWKAIGNL